MPTLNRRYGVALVLLVLIGSAARCKAPAGPFVTVTITGIPKDTTELVMTAVLGETNHSVDTSPTQTALPLTLDLPPGSRGSLVVTALASVKDTPCMLAMGTVTVQLDDDIAYEAMLPLAASPLTGCNDVPSVAKASLTVNKVENGAAGSIVSNLAGINCAVGCNQQVVNYSPGTEVTLTAQPGSGAQVKWSEPASCDTNFVCKVTINVNTTISATFTPCPHGSWCKEGVPGVDTDLFAVWGAGGSVYAVGGAGKILMRTIAGQWMPMTSPVTEPLRAIGGETGSATPYAVGDNGTVLQLNGTWGPVKLDQVAGKQITGITAEKNSAKTSAYLCTADGGFYIKDGSSAWSLVSATGKPLHGVSAANGSGTDGHEATVVGDAGFVFRRTFYTIQFPQQRTADNTNTNLTAATLHGVWTGSSLSVAVGDGGTIITRGTQDYGNTKAWTKVVSPVTSKLNSVWGGDDKNVWIVGDGGVVVKYDGSAATTQPSPVPPVDLTGVWAADATNVYAVGRNGAIFHYQP